MALKPDVLYSCLQTDLCPFSTSSGEWAVDATPRTVAASQLLASFYKKFVEQVSPEADDRAFEKFLAVNESCGNWKLDAETWEDELVGELKKSIYEFWNPYQRYYLDPNGPGRSARLPLVGSVGDIFASARVGPGASVGAKGNDFYTKLFSSPLTAGKSTLCHWYKYYVSKLPNWDAAEKFRANLYGEPHVVEGSRFHFVPKTVDISRLICVEPTLNTLFQLGFGACLEARLRQCFGIDFARQQDVSRELARRGSLDDGSFSPVTIDLSSASDSMSLKMLEFFLPRDFVSWLKDLRCEAGFRGGERVTLNMVSTMGNGFTFPLQTMFFACIVSAAARVNGVALVRTRGHTLGNFSVFGDDIVCPKAIARDVLRLLRLTGFKVNTEKTFVEGPFRESCGRDYYRGHDVRGVYVSKLQTQQHRFALINALNLWTAKTGLHLSNTVQYLLRSTKYQPVPVFENDDAGVKVPYSLVEGLRRSKRYSSILYRRDVARPKFLSIGEGEVFIPKGERRRCYNPHGLLLAFVRGSVVSGRIGIRHDHLRYQTKWGVAPFWDYCPSDNSVVLFSDWRRWNNAVHCNFLL